eukprot:509450_1
MLYLVSNFFVNILIIPMATVAISSLDAVKMKKMHKVAISILFAAASSIWICTYHFFFFPQEKDYVIYILHTNIYVSCQSAIWSTMKVASIFFWKQGIMVSIKLKEAVSIKYTLIIKWNNENKDEEQHERNEFSMAEISAQNDDKFYSKFYLL